MKSLKDLFYPLICQPRLKIKDQARRPPIERPFNREVLDIEKPFKREDAAVIKQI